MRYALSLFLFFFFVCLCPVVGGVTARGQPSAAQGPVVHVPLPGARHGRSVPAPEPHPAAGQQQLLHHHHPTDRLVSRLLIGLCQAAGCVEVLKSSIVCPLLPLFICCCLLLSD